MMQISLNQEINQEINLLNPILKVIIIRHQIYLIQKLILIDKKILSQIQIIKTSQIKNQTYINVITQSKFSQKEIYQQDQQTLMLNQMKI